MSQFPTSLENPGGPARAAANRAVAIPQTGIIANGNIVPQQILPPVSEGAQLAAELGQTFGLIGNAADTIRQFQEHQAALTERAQHEAERQAAHDRANAEAIATHERGQGALDAATRLPELVQQIGEGKIAREGMSASEQARAIIDGLVKGQPDAYSEGFRRTAQDNVARALTGVDQRLIDDNKKALAQSASSAAVLANTTDELNQAYLAAKSIGGVSDLEAKSLTYLAALQSAAKAGDTAKFQLASSALGPTTFAAEQKEAQAVLRNAGSQQAARDYQTAANVIGNELADVARGIPGASTERAQAQLDALGVSLSGHQRDELQRLIDTRRDEQLRQMHEDTFSAIERNVLIGNFPGGDPAAAMDDIARRMFLDKTDPGYVAPSRAAGLMGTIRNLAKVDTGAVRVGQYFQDAATGGGATFAGAPLTESDDASMLKFYQRAGVVNAAQDGEKLVFLGVADPLALARYSTLANRVPKAIESSLTAGIGSDNPQQVQAAAVTIGALASRSPSLVEAMDFGGNKLASARARFIASRVRDIGSAAAATPEALAQAVTPLVGSAMKINPSAVAYTPSQVLGLALFGNAEQATTDGAAFTINAARESRQEIKAALKSDAFWQDQPWYAALPRWAGGITIQDAPENVIKTYHRLLEQEFISIRSTTADETAAAEQAKKIALRRTLVEHPPIVWNDRLYFSGDKGMAFDPHMQDRIRADIFGLSQSAIQGTPGYTTPPPGFTGVAALPSEGALSLMPSGAREALRTAGASGMTFLPRWMFTDTAATVTVEEDRAALWNDLKSNYIPVADPTQGSNRIVFRFLGDANKLRMIATPRGIEPLVIDLSPATDDRGLGARALEAINTARTNRAASAASVAQAQAALSTIPPERRTGREMRQ